MARAKEEYLGLKEYRVVGTRDPRQAVAMAMEARPRAIVLDVMMPEMDGFDVLGELRRHPGTGDIPIVVCTILPQEALVKSLGVEAFLLKPVSRQVFLGTLDSL